MKNILAVIPARGGSKGIPRKNIVKINDRPLIDYTIQAALQVSRINHVIVSTEDEEIASISRGLGAEVPFMRPNHLAVDQAQSAPVVIDALYRMEEINNIKYDAVLMLQPTSPLRTSKHIEKALDLFFSQECDSVVSVVSVGGTHPFRMKRLVDDRLVNYIDQGFWDMRPRQELPPVYIRNGSIYLIERDVLINKGQMIGEKCLGMVMGDKESINIDTPLDLKLAELLLEEV
jgi:CMP-N,N'-diacetyllegionaminic acid synthase